MTLQINYTPIKFKINMLVTVCNPLSDKGFLIQIKASLIEVLY